MVKNQKSKNQIYIHCYITTILLDLLVYSENVRIYRNVFHVVQASSLAV